MDMKKVVAILFTLLLILNGWICSFAETEPRNETLPLEAEAAVVINGETGQVLYEKNMDQKMYPASTTKIMTALLVLENVDITKVVTMDRETELTNESQIYLLEGEQVTIEQLLYALLLKSANDAAVALAKEVAGSVPEFAQMMNARALELGANNTNFVTPNGLHDDKHYTTAYDLSIIAREAMKNEDFRRMVTTLNYTIPATNKSQERPLSNPNKLLYSSEEISVNGTRRPIKYEGTTGVKNGYTGEAGRCLVASAKRGDVELISVVLNTSASGKFSDSIMLLDYGFAKCRAEAELANAALEKEATADMSQEKGKTSFFTVMVTHKDGAVGVVMAVGIILVVFILMSIRKRSRRRKRN